MTAELFALVDGLARCPGPRLVARDGVVLAPSANAPALPGNGALDLDTIAERAARDPAFSAALLSRLDKLRPTNGLGTLMMGTPRPFPPSPDSVPSEKVDSSISQPGVFLSDLVSELLARVGSSRKFFLALLTLTAPPGRPIASLLDLDSHLGMLGAWLVIERTATGLEHVHGLLLTDTEDRARAIPITHAEKYGLDRDAQCCKPERGPLVEKSHTTRSRCRPMCAATCSERLLNTSGHRLLGDPLTKSSR
jgi:hypothetical protein